VPWFPEFTSAVELARRQTRAAGQADPVGQYVAALNDGDARTLATVWPGEVVVHDPRGGEIRGRRRLRRFVKQSQSWLAERSAQVETVASTVADGRAVVELLAHLTDDGRELAWPVSVVAEFPDERSVVFRSYFSRRALDGQAHLRPAILIPGSAWPDDVIGRHRTALAAGDAEALVRTFEPDGYYREPLGQSCAHRGADELRSFFTRYFSHIGGIDLQCCAVTDDGVRCAVEYNCVRRGRHELPPQAGIGIYERGPDGLLAAARVYDDVEPADHS
jgi:limonene-1,2-epoxide hydrolase